METLSVNNNIQYPVHPSVCINVVLFLSRKHPEGIGLPHIKQCINVHFISHLSIRIGTHYNIHVLEIMKFVWFISRSFVNIQGYSSYHTTRNYL